jgi:hypothetical protein
VFVGNDPTLWRPGLVTLVGAAIRFAVGVAPIPFRYHAFLWVLILAGLILYSNGDLLKCDIRLAVRDLLPILIVLAASIACDVLFISRESPVSYKNREVVQCLENLVSFGLQCTRRSAAGKSAGLFPFRVRTNDRHEKYVGLLGCL